MPTALLAAGDRDAGRRRSLKSLCTCPEQKARRRSGPALPHAETSMLPYAIHDADAAAPLSSGYSSRRQ